jgi:sec-independent protein translocase protein TatC
MFFGLSIWWTFYVGTPILAKFLLQFQIQKTSLVVEYQATLYAYISWIWSCLLIVFVVSQFPTLLFIAVIGKQITPEKITQYRKGIFILSVLIAAFISPPDILIQLMLALSFYIYIEFIIWCLFIYTNIHLK